MRFIITMIMAAACGVTLGCQTIRMRYNSKVLTEDGDRQEFIYENSYKIQGAHSTLCMITGIFLGGSCWYYLVMPTTQQKLMIGEDASDVLAKKLAGKKYEESRVRVVRVSYSEGGEDIHMSTLERPDADSP